jgi:predicted ABC-type ATPase
VSDVPRPGTVWVVAGAPGAGKSTVAAILNDSLDPAPAHLDKDTLFGGLVGRGDPKDEGKRAAYDAFFARLRHDQQPPVPHRSRKHN